jgi:hypothetical protein
MTFSHPRPVPCQWFSRLADSLDRRSAPRLSLLTASGTLYVSGTAQPDTIARKRTLIGRFIDYR